jgi:hypothetical protein
MEGSAGESRCEGGSGMKASAKMKALALVMAGFAADAAEAVEMLLDMGEINDAQAARLTRALAKGGI